MDFSTTLFLIIVYNISKKSVDFEENSILFGIATRQEDRLRKKTSHKSMKQWVEEKDFSTVYETSN